MSPSTSSNASRSARDTPHRDTTPRNNVTYRWVEEDPNVDQLGALLQKVHGATKAVLYAGLTTARLIAKYGYIYTDDDPPRIRQRNMSDWNEKGGIMVATRTLDAGTGADLSNVALVVHWGVCNTSDVLDRLDGAGRDGKPAAAVLVCKREDAQDEMEDLVQAGFLSRCRRQAVKKYLRISRAPACGWTDNSCDYCEGQNKVAGGTPSATTREPQGQEVGRAAETSIAVRGMSRRTTRGADEPLMVTGLEPKKNRGSTNKKPIPMTGLERRSTTNAVTLASRARQAEKTTTPTQNHQPPTKRSPTQATPADLGPLQKVLGEMLEGERSGVKRCADCTLEEIRHNHYTKECQNIDGLAEWSEEQLQAAHQALEQANKERRQGSYIEADEDLKDRFYVEILMVLMGKWPRVMQMLEGSAVVDGSRMYIAMSEAIKQYQDLRPQ